MQRKNKSLSDWNNIILKSYCIIFYIAMKLLRNMFLVEVIYNSSPFCIKETWFAGCRGFVNTQVSNQYFTLFSIVISLLSVVLAALALIFGSIKICGVNSSTIVKNIFRSEFLLSRIAVCLSPFLLIGLAVSDLKYTFSLVFLFFIFTIVYLLHLCLAVHLDRGVRYILIPRYVYKEITDGRFDNRESVYKQFIDNICDEQFVESKKVFMLIVMEMINDKGISEDRILNYKRTYLLLQDLRKGMIRNYGCGEEFLCKYFELCTEAFCQVLKDCKEHTRRVGMFLAVFCNIAECAKIQEVNADSYRSEIKKFFNQMIQVVGIHSENLFDYLFLSLLPLEIILQQEQHAELYLNEYVYYAIEQLADETFFGTIEEKDFYQKAQSFMFIMFKVHRAADQISAKEYKDYFAAFKSLLGDFNVLFCIYRSVGLMGKKKGHAAYLSYTFLLYTVSKKRRETNGFG